MIDPSGTNPSDTEIVAELLTARTGKWTATVVLRLRGQTRRFSELRRDIGTISQKALTLTLRGLERDGFVSRTSFATIPPRVDYRLTEMGVEASRLFESWEAFARRHAAEMRTSRQRFDAELESEPVAVDIALQRSSSR